MFDSLKTLIKATKLPQGRFDAQRAGAQIQAALQQAGLLAASGLQQRRQHGGGDVVDVEARVVGGSDSSGSTGSSGSAPAGRFSAGHHASNGTGRDYKLYVPASAATATAPMALVVMLHGCTQDPDDFAAGTRMNQAAERLGFCVLYPAQAQNANPQRCWNWFKHNHQQKGRGEPAVLAGMTREVMATQRIDPRRVFVAGLSAGGAMAAILGDTYPELFAAVGVHSGLASGAARDMPGAFEAMRSGAAVSPARLRAAPPTIVFHGDSDVTVHPKNGEQAAAAAAVAAGLQVERRQVGAASGRGSTCQVWRDGNRVVAEHWLVHGAGHAWSGGSAAGSYTDSRGPNATDEMLRFFFATAGA